MKNIWKNYKATIILLAAMIVGAIIGLIAKENAAVLSPIGDLYINLLMVIIVPLIFLTITTSIAKMKQPKRLGKVMTVILVVIIITSIISVLAGLASTYFVKLVDPEDGEQIKASLETETEVTEEETEISIPEQLVSTLTVSDFNKLLTRDNIIAVLVFAILFGFAINLSKEKGEPILKVLDSANEVVLNFIKITTYIAPIGLGCYLAALVGTFGASIAIGYAKTFIYYNIVAIVFFAVAYTLYAFIAGGKKGIIAYWKNILPPAATALATCSSGASIPVSMEAAKKMGVSEDIAATTVSIGTNFHKDGSIIGSVFKIMFLVCLFGATVGSSVGIFEILGIALFATLLVTAVPIGGGTISETLIITMLGYPLAALPILTMVATVIDPLATVLNVTGNTANSMLVSRFVDGKDWMNEKKEKTIEKKKEKEKEKVK